MVVNDKMQRGYRYVLVGNRSGAILIRNSSLELTPKKMLAFGVFGGKYMTDCRKEFPSSWFTRAKLSPSEKKTNALNYFGVDASQPLIGVAPERLASRRRSARLVSMVLPLLFGSPLT